MRELLAALIEAMELSKDHPLDEQSGSPSDVFGSVANTARARDELAWTPRVAFKDGLADMVRWAKTQD